MTLSVSFSELRAIFAEAKEIYLSPHFMKAFYEYMREEHE